MIRKWLPSILLSCLLLPALSAADTQATTNRLKFQDSIERPAFAENDVFITVAYGFGNFLRSTFEANDLSSNQQIRTAIGPLMAKGAWALSSNLDFGVHLAFMSLKNEWTDTAARSSGTGHYSGWSALARVNYHLKPGRFFDPYLGFGVGYRRDRIKETSTNPSSGNKFEENILLIPFNLGMDVTIGFRLMATEHLGIMMETGIAKGIVQLGLVYRP
jgi:opacity protein-like surface antigen